MNREEVLSKITKWCSYQDRSEFETVKKLLSYGLSKKEIDEVIQYLQKENYLNERRFVQSFVNGKLHLKKWGVEKIKYYLISKHYVDPALIEEVFKEINYYDYLETLKQIVLKKKSLLEKKEKDNQLLKKKIINFALSKGFSYWDILKVIQELNF